MSQLGYSRGNYNQLPITDLGPYSGGEFACASCGFEYIHLIDASPIYEPTHWDQPRSYVLLYFYCEGCEDGTEWRIGNHKGITSAEASVVNLKDVYRDKFRRGSTGPFR